MNNKHDDIFLKLQETINSWADEVTQARSVLTERVSSDSGSSGAAFTLMPESRIEARSVAPLTRTPAITSSTGKKTIQTPAQLEDKQQLRRIEDLEAQIVELRGALEGAERFGVRLEAELEFAREQLLKLNAENSVAPVGQPDTDRNLKDASDILVRARNEIASLQKALRAKEWDLFKANDKNNLLQEDYTREIDLTSKLVPRVQDLERRVEDQLATQETVSHELDATYDRIAYVESELADSAEKIDHLLKEVKVLTLEREEQRLELEQAALELDHLNSEVATREAELLEGRHRLDDLAASEARHREQAEMSEAKLRDLEVSLVGQADEIEELQQTLGETTDLLESSNVEAARLSAEVDKRSSRLSELEELVVAMRSRESAHKELVDQAESRIRSLENSLSRQIETNGALREELNLSRGESQGRERELNTALERVETQGLDYDALVSSHMELRETLKELQSALIEREHVLMEAEAKIREVNVAVELSGQETDSVDEKVSLESSSGEHSAGLAVGKDALITALRQELDSLRQIAVEKDFVINHAHEEIESLTSRYARQEKALKDAAQRTEQLVRSEGRSADNRKVFQLAIGDLKERSRTKEVALQSLQDDLDTLTGKYESLYEAQEARQSAERPDVIAQVVIPQVHDFTVDEDVPEPSALRPLSLPETVADMDVDFIQPNADLQHELERESAPKLVTSNVIYIVSALFGVLGLIAAAASFMIGTSTSAIEMGISPLQTPVGDVDLLLWLSICLGLVALAGMGLVALGFFQPESRRRVDR